MAWKEELPVSYCPAGESHVRELGLATFPKGVSSLSMVVIEENWNCFISPLHFLIRRRGSMQIKCHAWSCMISVEAFWRKPWVMSAHSSPLPSHLWVSQGLTQSCPQHYESSATIDHFIHLKLAWQQSLGLIEWPCLNKQVQEWWRMITSTNLGLAHARVHACAHLPRRPHMYPLYPQPKWCPLWHKVNLCAPHHTRYPMYAYCIYASSWKPHDTWSLL